MARLIHWGSEYLTNQLDGYKIPGLVRFKNNALIKGLHKIEQLYLNEIHMIMD